ncbi:unnamed protein product [Diamesa hyperborea]
MCLNGSPIFPIIYYSHLIADDDEDLEDGEIDESDEDVILVSEIKAPKSNVTELTTPVIVINSDPVKPEKSNYSKKSSNSSKSSKATFGNNEDDFASNIENAIANALKKDDNRNNRRKERWNTEDRKRRKKQKKEKNRDRQARKKSKIENDGFYMVGGSPQHTVSDSEDSDTSNSSYDSDEYHRNSYEERRNKRRDKYGANRGNNNNGKNRRERDNEKELCLRFSEFGNCPEGDSCTRVHEVRAPKKMELCKFYLMECCAKREKCSYMHGDFPCKYYYLGLKCMNKDCKFNHGKPLTENLKMILLKHLDTAPKEILGDFPRIGRENALKMIAVTHAKLMIEFKMAEPAPPAGNSSQSKIPSLLEMNIKPPEFKDNLSNRKSTRWIQNEDSPMHDEQFTTTTAPTANPSDILLADLSRILSIKQIEAMAALSVTTVNHINNLTVAQLNDLGLSLATIGEIQATAMNMLMGMKPPPIEINENSGVYKKPPTPTRQVASMMSPPAPSMMSPPGMVDYSQYLKDSNLKDDEDDDELRIDESYCNSDYDEDKKDQSESDHGDEDTNKNNFEMTLLPPAFDTTMFLKSTSVAKVDISSSVQKLLAPPAAVEVIKTVEVSPPASTTSRDPRSRDPRMQSKPATSPSKSPKMSDIGSPTQRDPRAKPEYVKQTSIYEIESPSEDEDIVKLDRDKDMRLPPFLRDTENGDVDLRFPFTPLSNYVPATEIEGAYGTHLFEKYNVHVVEVPKPDYAEVRRSFKFNWESSADPRLKKICGKMDEVKEAPKEKKVEVVSLVPQSDPRKRKIQEAAAAAEATSASSARKLQITTILQNSQHYKDLSSSQKMVVNQLLAELSLELKRFHADPTSNKIFDSSFITQQPRLQQVLVGLNVYVNATGEFEEITESKTFSLPNMHQMPPMPGMMNIPPPSMLPMTGMIPAMPPQAFMAGLRPGLLGIAPNLQFNHFDADVRQQQMNNFPSMNQGQNNFDVGLNQNFQQFRGDNSSNSNNINNNINRNNNSNNNNNSNRRDFRNNNSNQNRNNRNNNNNSNNNFGNNNNRRNNNRRD